MDIISEIFSPLRPKPQPKLKLDPAKSSSKKSYWDFKDSPARSSDTSNEIKCKQTLCILENKQPVFLAEAGISYTTEEVEEIEKRYIDKHGYFPSGVFG